MASTDRNSGGTSGDQGRHMAPWGASPPAHPQAQVGATEVSELIERADAHDLGRSFLLEGAQDSVAATFGVHAFVVDAARAHLANPS